MTQVKICGLKSEQDIRYANELKPDYIGFVFQKGRKRYVSPERASHLRRLLDPRISAAGVFVNEPMENVISLLEAGTIQMAQLHGSEDPDYCQRLKRLCNRPVIKAFVIQTREDVKRAAAFPCDYLLLDGGLGAGRPFDWSLIRNMDRPFFLAGGLNCGNVADSISLCHPYAVDVSSGVETLIPGTSDTESSGTAEDSCKDYDKMRTFIHIVRTHTQKI